MQSQQLLEPKSSLYAHTIVQGLAVVSLFSTVHFQTTAGAKILFVCPLELGEIFDVNIMVSLAVSWGVSPPPQS